MGVESLQSQDTDIFITSGHRSIKKSQKFVMILFLNSKHVFKIHVQELLRSFLPGPLFKNTYVVYWTIAWLLCLFSFMNM